MFKNIQDFFRKAWKWIEALWDKHDETLKEIVAAVLPMVIAVARRGDLSGEQKKKVIVDAIVDNAEDSADAISHSMLNEAIEIAASRYNIQIGELTAARMDAAREAALKAARDFSNQKLKITGQEAEEAGVSLSNEDVE